MVYLKIVAGITLIISVAWVLAKPGYDSGVAVLVSLSALITAFITDSKRRSGPRQQQNVSKSSVGIQSGGDAIVEGIRVNKDAK